MLDQKCFDAIGLKTKNPEEFSRQLDTLSKLGQFPISPNGFYVYWRGGNGSEVWLAYNKQKEPLSFAPHFLGSSRIKVRLLTTYNVSAYLEGMLHVEVQDDQDLSIPLVFAVPSWDFTYLMLLKKQEAATERITFSVQLAAFAENLRCFDNEEEYYKNQEHNFAAAHFIPSGLFTGADTTPKPTALFSGKVLEGHVLLNPLTSQRTAYLKVETANMTLDVVADPAIVQGRPIIGGIIEGSFWLSGRAMEEVDAANKFFDS